MTNRTYREYIAEAALLLAVAAAAFFLVRFVGRARAGSLTPSGAPASTFVNLQQIFDPVAGSYSTATTTASSTGNLLQQARCMITRMDGGSC